MAKKINKINFNGNEYELQSVEDPSHEAKIAALAQKIEELQKYAAALTTEMNELLTKGSDAEFASVKAKTFTGDLKGTADRASAVDWNKVENKPATYPATAHNHDASYPSTTGARATGTWKIDISGKAAKAGVADSANAVSWTNVTGKPSLYSTTGGSVTGTIDVKSTSTSFVGGRNQAAIRQKTWNNYSPFTSIKTQNGSWDNGAYDSNTLHWSYITDDNFNKNNNTQTADIQFKSNGEVQANAFRGALHGTADNASKLTTARNIALSGAVNGNVNFDGTGNVNITAKRRSVQITQSGTPGNNVWYKVAWYTFPGDWYDANIMFMIRDTFANNRQGILSIRARSGKDGIWESSRISWLNNSGYNSSDFVLLHNTAKPSTVELWTKISDAYMGRDFVVLSEGNRDGGDKVVWTLANDISGTAGAAAYTSGMTAQVSELDGHVLNAERLSGIPVAPNQNTGHVWNYIPWVKGDGVMEVGKYIDFHATSNDGKDYTSRFTAETNGSVTVNTINGTLNGNASTSSAPLGLSRGAAGSWGKGNGIGTWVTGWANNGAEIAFRNNSGQLNVVIDGQYYANEGNSLVLHEGNYNNYAPTKTGGGASGTWGINVTGSAGSVAWGNVTGRPSVMEPTFNNGKWYNVGDDVKIGDFNHGGLLGICGLNAATGIGLAKKGAETDYASITYDGGNIVFNKTLQANITGNAGTASKTISEGGGTSWVTGRDTALLKMNSAAGDYRPVVSAKTKNGSWEYGTYVDNIAHFSYITDDDYNKKNNRQNCDIMLKPSGEVQAPAFRGRLYGTADAANSLANFFTNGQPAPKNCNDMASNSVCYYTSGGPATSLGATTNDGALYSQAYNTSWVGQIAQDYRNGSLFVRGKNNGTWTAWKRMVWNEGTWSINVTGSAGSVAWGNVSGKPSLLGTGGGTMTGTITFAGISDVAKSAGLSWGGSTDGASIYYQTTAKDQGNLVLNCTDDANCYIRIAYNGDFKSYFTPSDGVFHGNVAGNASSASSVAWGNVSGKPAVLTDGGTHGTVKLSNWIRTTGNTGWYSETYGGGWYMTDTTWVRAYNGKSVYSPAQMLAEGNITTNHGLLCKTIDSSLWGGWNKCIQFQNGSHAAIYNSAGGSFIGIHSNKNIYFGNHADQKYYAEVHPDGFYGTLHGNCTGNAGTASNINNQQPRLANASESNEIAIHDYGNNSWGNGVNAVRKAIDFDWYNTRWSIGNIRGGSTDSVGFGFGYKVDKTKGFNKVAWIDTNGTYHGNVTGSAGSVAWGNVSGKPAQATRWPSWGEVTGKPASMPANGGTASYANRLNVDAGNELCLNGAFAGGALWFGYRCDSIKGAITEYKFGNGMKNGGLAQVTASQFNGKLNGSCTGSAGSVAWGNVSGKPAQATRWPSWGEVTEKPGSMPANGGTADLARVSWGRYTGNGGQQPPSYFGKERAGFLMSNVNVNGHTAYKNWLYMDNYSGNDVGGASAIGVARDSCRAFIMVNANADRKAWTGTAELLSTANYNSYAPTKTGGGASGTWGINITGSAGSIDWSKVGNKPATATRWPSWGEVTGKPTSMPANGGTASAANFLNVNTGLTYGNNGLQYFNLSSTSRGAANTNGTPINDWVHIIRMNHGNKNGYYVDLAAGLNINGLWYRRVTAGSMSGWHTVLDSTNYNSYAPTKTGGGASGTWGINITGSAGSIDWSKVGNKPAQATRWPSFAEVTGKPKLLKVTGWNASTGALTIADA